MSNNITVPDIGDFESVEIIEVLVKVGDQVEMIDFRIVEQTAFTSSIHQFSKSYQGTPEQIIQNI